MTGAAHKPLVLVGGQTEQIPSGDYLLSPGGASFNSMPATTPGDIEVTTINGGTPYVIGTGSVAVAEVHQVGDAVGFLAPNLTTEGSTDWIAASSTATIPSCSESTYHKVTGLSMLGCTSGGIYPWVGANPGGLYGVAVGSCPIAITWASSDSAQGAAPTNPALRGWNGFPGGAGLSDNGFMYGAPAMQTQLVLRQYLVLGNGTGAYCEASLTDGSGSASTVGTPWNSVGIGNVWIKVTWTYHSASPTSTLKVKCHIGTSGASGSAGAYFAWLAETLAPT